MNRQQNDLSAHRNPPRRWKGASCALSDTRHNENRHGGAPFFCLRENARRSSARGSSISHQVEPKSPCRAHAARFLTFLTFFPMRIELEER